MLYYFPLQRVQNMAQNLCRFNFSAYESIWGVKLMFRSQNSPSCNDFTNQDILTKCLQVNVEGFAQTPLNAETLNEGGLSPSKNKRENSF